MATHIKKQACVCGRYLRYFTPTSRLSVPLCLSLNATRTTTFVTWCTASAPRLKPKLFSAIVTPSLHSVHPSLCRGYVSSAGGGPSPSDEDQLTPKEHEIVENLFSGLCEGKRAALARSITLVESVNERKKLQAQKLLKMILEEDRRRKKHKLLRVDSFRIGLCSDSSFAHKYTIY